MSLFTLGLLVLGACGQNLRAVTPDVPPTLTPIATPTSMPTPTPTAAPTSTLLPSEPPCIPSGDNTSIQDALTEVGSKAELCLGAVFELSATVFYTADDQEIFTRGFPRDESRALLRIAHRDVVTAVQAGNNSRVKLRNVIIDGSRPEFGIGEGGLIEWGGAATDQVGSGSRPTSQEAGRSWSSATAMN